MFQRLTMQLAKTLTYFRHEKLPIPQQIMLQTVRDTHEYHNFIPWCKDSKIIKKISQMENYTQLTISFNDLKQISYTSHVVIEKHEDDCTVTSICRETPLKYLKSVWTIKQHSESQTSIEYFLDFQFDSLIYQLTSSIFLNVMGKSMMDIFLRRAQEKSKQLRKKKSEILSTNCLKQPLNSVSEVQVSTNEVLKTYLSNKEKLKLLMQSNLDISQEVKNIAKRLSNTSNFSQKMNFQIKNMLTHHNLSPQSDVFKELH